MLTLTDVDLVRGGRRLFAPASLRLEAGEAVVIAGPNGAGKTSLLRAVAGLLRPASGEIAFDGYDDLETARAEALHWQGWHDGLKAARRAVPNGPADEILTLFCMASQGSYDCAHRKTCEYPCRERLD